MHVCDLSSGLDCLERVINLLGILHFLYHALAKVHVPQALNVKILARVQLTRVFVLICGSLGDLSIFALTLNAARNGGLFVLDAFLELKNALLSVLLLKLDVLHEAIKNSLGLQALLLGLALFGVLELQNLLFRLEAGFKLSGTKLGGDEVTFQALLHVVVRGLRQDFFVYLVTSLLVLLRQLLKPRLHGESGSDCPLLLQAELVDFLFDGVEFSLLRDADALGLVVLLFYLAQLSGHLSDLLGIVLHRRGVVRGLQKRIHLLVGAGAVVQPATTVVSKPLTCNAFRR